MISIACPICNKPMLLHEATLQKVTPQILKCDECDTRGVVAYRNNEAFFRNLNRKQVVEKLCEEIKKVV